jgi:hypothetical protein
LAPFSPEERLTKYGDRINRWWKRTWSQKSPDAMARIDEESRADQERLHAVFAERADGLELADCLLRFYENTAAYVYYNGFRRGYVIGVNVGKDDPGEAITKIISKRLKATPREICELIDEHNSRFDDLNDSRRIHLKWPELRRQYNRWTDVAPIPKVKNYLVRIRRQAQEISRIQNYQRLMKEHESNRKPTRKVHSAEQHTKLPSESTIR